MTVRKVVDQFIPKVNEAAHGMAEKLAAAKRIAIPLLDAVQPHTRKSQD